MTDSKSRPIDGDDLMQAFAADGRAEVDPEAKAEYAKSLKSLQEAAARPPKRPDPLRPEATYIERPLDIYESVTGEIIKGSLGVEPSGPWVAVCLANNVWTCGELVSDPEDAGITLRTVYDVKPTGGPDGEVNVRLMDSTIDADDILAICTIEGIDWGIKRDDELAQEDQTHDPRTGFPLKNKEVKA